MARPARHEDADGHVVNKVLIQVGRGRNDHQFVERNHLVAFGVVCDSTHLNVQDVELRTAQGKPFYDSSALRVLSPL